MDIYFARSRVHPSTERGSIMTPTRKKKTTAKKVTRKKVAKKAAVKTKKAATKKDAKKAAAKGRKSSAMRVTKKVARKVARKPAKSSGLSNNTPPEERWRLIAVAAYHKAERRGFAPGGELQDWTEAEKEIDELLS